MMPDSITRPVPEGGPEGHWRQVRAAVGSDEAARGVCRLLAIYWAVEVAQAGAPAPDAVWQDMLARAPLYFRLVAQQQAGRAARLAGRGWRRALGDAVGCASRHSFDVASLAPRDSAASAGALTLRIAEALAASPALPRLCLVRLAWPGGAHCLAIAAADGRIYLFDPHAGVAVLDSAAPSHLATAMRNLFAVYRTGRANVAVVI
ncbi:hypothetical protein [Ferrovibrio xuzhouensis]|uniref:Peptidase C58 YopT-type domain-containing protein n=1 Tax=Ferrovibrio xuzhouensis TaxID=1576914 RepID=A0ABV7VD78_9PROT